MPEQIDRVLDAPRALQGAGVHRDTKSLREFLPVECFCLAGQLYGALQQATDRIETILADAPEPLTLRAVRTAAKLRAATVSDALAALVTQGRATRTGKGYVIVPR